jgi:hypothetical protein
VSVLDGDDRSTWRALASRIATSRSPWAPGCRRPPLPWAGSCWPTSPSQLDAHLSRTELRRLTEHTICDPLSCARCWPPCAAGWAAVTRAEGVRSIAVPIRDGSHKVVAAISASAHAAQVPMRR